MLIRKLIFITLAIIYLFPRVQSQPLPPLAPEVWSEPERVDSFSTRFVWESNPSFTQSMDTIYYERSPGGIHMSYLIDGVWQSPIRLNSNVNDGSPTRDPSISRDGRRLYYSSWGGYGGWDLWFSDWDTAMNDWGQSVNMGPSINTAGWEYSIFELSKDTIYVVNGRWFSQGVCVYIWDYEKNDWSIIDSTSFGVYNGRILGLSITADRRKAYFGRYILAIPDSLQSEIYVSYRDSLNNRWGDVYSLNINSSAYQRPGLDSWSGGRDEYPWISPDGKVLYFTSNRDAAREDSVSTPDIYVSYLLIDENGNPVSVKNGKSKYQPIEYKLFPPYPNPFNPEVNISFELPENGEVSLTIYNILGQRVDRLIDLDYYVKGTHTIRWNISQSAINVSSGTYIVQLHTKNASLTQKIVYVK